jgi:protoporphyrin/coproporphyrin ferrochelatase
MSKKAVVLIAHGTVEKLDDLPAFLGNIRRGQPANAELIAEVRRRYEAIGGKSPLLTITKSLAAKVERALSVPTRVAMRLWHPYPKEVLTALAGEGVTKVAVVPLAQHSAAIYGTSMKEAAAALAKESGAAELEIAAASNWGRNGTLLDAYANSIHRAVAKIAESDRARTRIVMTAHSLPTFIVKQGDPYEEEVRASAMMIALRLGPNAPDYVVAFQSQGMSGPGPGGKPVEWLGPDLRSAIDAAAHDGMRHLVVAPIGFLADHVEILYDIDIEAKAWAQERKIVLHRSESLNDGDGMVRAVVEVARPLLGGT